MYDVDAVIALAMQVEALNKKIDGLSVLNQPTSMMQCDLCGGIHGNQGWKEMKNLTMPSEHVDYIVNAPQP